MKGSTCKIKNMAMESSTGLMKKDMKVGGSMASKRVMEYSTTRRKRSTLNGKMEIK